MTTADVMVPTQWRVADRWEETYDVFSFALEPTEIGVEAKFEPGQFNMLYAFGTGESAISISGDPRKGDGRLVHTVRRVGTVTDALFRLEEGDSIGVRGPFGSPWPMDALKGKDILFVAGGIGLAPLRPAILHALNDHQAFGKLSVLSGSRSPSDALYLGELSEWQASGNIECLLTVDHAVGDWHDHVGVVTKLIRKANFDPDNAVALVCGPEIMMRYASIELKNSGLAEESIYVTLERNMKCAAAFCGHCQLGPEFICKNGPVFRYDRVAFWLSQREV